MEQQIENKVVETKRPKVNLLWWVAIGVLIFMGLVLNNYYRDLAWALKLSGWIVISCIVIFIFYQTIEGRRLFAFAKAAKIELYKVVWPTRQETVHTTMIVAALVIAMSLIMWGMDSILLWLVGLLQK